MSSVAAFRLNGNRRWLSAPSWGYGFCADGSEQPGLRADGTYGPIGPEGDFNWGVDQEASYVPGGRTGRASVIR